MHTLGLYSQKSTRHVFLTIFHVICDVIKIYPFFSSLDFLLNLSCLKVKDIELRGVVLVLENQFAFIVMQN
jgi:hypothetical protein